MDFDSFFEKIKTLDRRNFLKLAGTLSGLFLAGNPLKVFAQAKKRISIATGGTGGVYYPIGGAMASVITKYIPGVDATAEVTAASVDNCLLVAKKKADLGIIMGDTGYDAFNGTAKFKEKLPIRNLFVAYINYTHIVALEGKGIKGVADLKGKRVSTGAPNSGTEVIALRVLEAYGINPDKDITRDRLSVAESAGALKDGKIDAFVWSGGLPTASVLDLAATPGTKIRILAHQDCISKMVKKYGPVYFGGVIPKGMYPGINYEIPVSALSNLVICHQELEDKLAYDILKVMFEHQKDLVAVHKEAAHITIENAVAGSPIPYHKAAQRYFKEKGHKVQA